MLKARAPSKLKQMEDMYLIVPDNASILPFLSCFFVANRIAYWTNVRKKRHPPGRSWTSSARWEHGRKSQYNQEDLAFPLAESVTSSLWKGGVVGEIWTGSIYLFFSVSYRVTSLAYYFLYCPGKSSSIDGNISWIIWWWSHDLSREESGRRGGFHYGVIVW